MGYMTPNDIPLYLKHHLHTELSLVVELFSDQNRISKMVSSWKSSSNLSFDLGSFLKSHFTSISHGQEFVTACQNAQFIRSNHGAHSEHEDEYISMQAYMLTLISLQYKDNTIRVQPCITEVGVVHVDGLDPLLDVTSKFLTEDDSTYARHPRNRPKITNEQVNKVIAGTWDEVMMSVFADEAAAYLNIQLHERGRPVVEETSVKYANAHTCGYIYLVSSTLGAAEVPTGSFETGKTSSSIIKWMAMSKEEDDAALLSKNSDSIEFKRVSDKRIQRMISANALSSKTSKTVSIIARHVINACARHRNSFMSFMIPHASFDMI